MSKLIFALIMVALLVFIAACGGSPSSSSTLTRPITTLPPITSTLIPTTTQAGVETNNPTGAVTSTSVIPTIITVVPPSSTSPNTTLTAPPSSPAQTPATTTTPLPTTVYKPEAAPYIPARVEKELFEYILGLINKDRADQKLTPVQLAYNAAAQKHAQDMLKNNYLAHWDTAGLKPYMRYTFEGGLNYEQENSAYSSGNQKIDVKNEIKDLEYTMVYNDAGSNWSHRDAIWNKLHKKVSLGLAYNDTNLALVQQFEGDYVEFYQPPTLKGTMLALSGHFTLKGMTLNNTAVTYDALPQPLSGVQLASGAYSSYKLGNIVGQVFAPPPAGSQYNSLPANSIVAQKGLVKDETFWLEADISPLLTRGPGVYTICLIAVMDGQPQNFTNYSIQVK